MSPKETAYIVDRLAVRFMSIVADYERKIVEHRDSFGARTKADAKIIEGLRAAADEQVLSASKVAYVLRCAGETPVQAAQRVVKERDGLLTQVQDMREEIIRVNEAHGRTKVEHDGLLDELAVQRDAFTANVERIRCEGRDALRAEVAALQERLRASIARGDFAQMEVAALKPQIPKHPVKVGEWVKASNGAVAQVLEVHKDWYLIARGHGWTFDNCEPCDPPIVKREPTIGDTVRLVEVVSEATHDTDAGKAAAESGLLINGGLDVRKVTT